MDINTGKPPEKTEGIQAGEPTPLETRMALAMGELNSIPKLGTYQGHGGYDYARDTDISQAARDVLARHGLSLNAEVVEVVTDERVESSKGNLMNHVVIKMRFTISCGETGESRQSLWFGKSFDTSDKGLTKAIVNGMKYWLKSTFVMSTEGVEESDRNSPNLPERGAQPSAPAPAARGNNQAPRPAMSRVAEKLQAVSGLFVNVRRDDWKKVSTDILGTEATDQEKVGLLNRIQGLRQSGTLNARSDLDDIISFTQETIRFEEEMARAIPAMEESNASV